MEKETDVANLADALTSDKDVVDVRVAEITAIQGTLGRRVQTNLTDAAWIPRSQDASLDVGDRVWLIQQGASFIVGGRLSGEPAGVPIGTIMLFAGATPPAGWMAADGSAISRTTYAKLLAVTGLGYGVGDGSTTFNLPDLGARFPMGAKGVAPLQTTTGGALTVTLTTAQIPAHDHGSGGSHAHALNDIGAAFVTAGGALGALVSDPPDDWATTSNGTHTHTSVGSGAAHENLPPYLAILYIIRVI